MLREGMAMVRTQGGCHLLSRYTPYLSTPLDYHKQMMDRIVRLVQAGHVFLANVLTLGYALLSVP